MVDGWHAPALDALNRSAVPWTEEAFYRYLRHGHSPWHAAAGGPMAQIVREMNSVPDDVLRDIAAYLAALNPASGRLTVADTQRLAQQAVQRAACRPLCRMRRSGSFRAVAGLVTTMAMAPSYWV